MASPVKTRKITVSTENGPEHVHCVVDLSAFIESGQFLSTKQHVTQVLSRCNKPDEPSVHELVVYGNSLVAEHNRRYPDKRIPYIVVHAVAVRLQVSTSIKTPGVESVEQLREERIEKKTTTFTDLAAVVKGMTEEQQIAMLLTMGGAAEKLIDMTGGLTEAEQIEYFCSYPDYKGVPTPVSGPVTTKETIFGDVWTITRYPDRTSVVNGTYICTRTNPIDTVAGGIHGEAPYCFLIALWHSNRAFMRTRGFKSPCELLNVLKHAGKIIAPGKMFERDSILPVAQFLKVTIMVIVNDAKDERFNDEGLIGDGPEMLHVYLVSLKSRHYVSDTE